MQKPLDETVDQPNLSKIEWAYTGEKGNYGKEFELTASHMPCYILKK